MIIGSGLLAKAFEDRLGSDPRVCIFASGVSNSQCTDPAEFERENRLLRDTLMRMPPDGLFVYFSTCSVADPAAAGSPYVLHKLAMESLISDWPSHLICRLPQVAGRTPNPHTLLSYLASCISTGRRFSIWSGASRNVIDVDDVAALVGEVIKTGVNIIKTLNIASPANHPMTEIVSAMENAMQKKAVFERVERGCSYDIDVRDILPLCNSAGVDFQNDYLDRVIRKYHGST
jgi:nucleoside-diphosphate-sugar epimerase